MKSALFVLIAGLFLLSFSIAGRTQSPQTMRFSPQQFNAACGTKKIDCTDAINKCIQAAYGEGERYSVCELPAGRYLVARPLTFCAPIQGVSSNGTVIVVEDSFAGHFVLDFNCPHGIQNYIDNLSIDLTVLGARGNVTAFGSSSPGGGGGSSLGRYSNIRVFSSSHDTFAVSARSKKAEPGMFTGSTWTNLYIAAPCNLEIGQNQDDGTIIGLRAYITGPCRHSGSGISVSSNWKLIDSYVAVASANAAAPVTCGTNTDFDGLFIEGIGTGAINDPWLIQYDSGALGPCRISRLNTNIVLAGNSPDQALIRVNVPTTPQKYQGIVLGNFAVTSGGLPAPTLFSFFNSGTNTLAGPLILSVQGVGWEVFEGHFAKIGSGSSPNPGNVLRLVGSFGGQSGTLDAAIPAAGEVPSWKAVQHPAGGGRL